MNIIFYSLVLIAFCFSAFKQIMWNPVSVVTSPDGVLAPLVAPLISPMQVLANSMIESAKGAVELSIGLIGVMTLFLGLMKVAEAGGLLKVISKVLRPILVRLFPDVPEDHPAMGAIVMNISANVMGLGNAATPFGVKAMQELDSLNEKKGSATNAMILFLAINTSSVTLLPTGVIALRAAAGSSNPAGILPTTLFATFCSTIVAILISKLLAKYYDRKNAEIPSGATEAEILKKNKPNFLDDLKNNWLSYFSLLLVVLFIPLTVLYGKVISPWVVPSLMLGLLSFGFFRKVPVYEAFVDGAKDGFQVAIKIIPYLVGILVVVAMFRASGALEALIGPLSQLTSLFGLPGEALPMALLRPLSGSGAYGILASVIENPMIGPDSYIGYLVSTFQGSTETTFYVIAVYFGAVQVKNIRYALWPALLADLAGVIGAVFICSFLYG